MPYALQGGVLEARGEARRLDKVTKRSKVNNGLETETPLGSCLVNKWLKDGLLVDKGYGFMNNYLSKERKTKKSNAWLRVHVTVGASRVSTTL